MDACFRDEENADEKVHLTDEWCGAFTIVASTPEGDIVVTLSDEDAFAFVAAAVNLLNVNRKATMEQIAWMNEHKAKEQAKADRPEPSMN